MDFELERFKTQINLTAYASSRGYALVPRESGAACAVMVHASHDKVVIVRREENGHWVYFSVRDDQDNGTVIDFALRRGFGDLGRVRRELRAWLGDGGTEQITRLAPETWQREVLPQKTDQAAVAATWAATTTVMSNSRFLNSRGLRPETLTCDRFRDTWRQDARGNVVFPHTTAEGISGWEIKNLAYTGFSAQGFKTAWRSSFLPTDTRLALTESAIDALSYHQLRPDPHTRYMSTGGRLGKHQPAVLIEEIKALVDGTIILAFDNDLAGAALAHDVEVLVPTASFVRSAPRKLKDWNDVLQAQEQTYIRSLA